MRRKISLVSVILVSMFALAACYNIHGATVMQGTTNDTAVQAIS